VSTRSHGKGQAYVSVSVCVASVRYNKHPLTYIGMIQVLHYPYFSEELLQTSWVELCLVNDLDGHLLSCRYVSGEFDFGKVSFPNRLEQLVLSHVHLVPWWTGRRRRTTTTVWRGGVAPCVSSRGGAVVVARWARAGVPMTAVATVATVTMATGVSVGAL
jgi:hypothetical protein